MFSDMVGHESCESEFFIDVAVTKNALKENE